MGLLPNTLGNFGERDCVVIKTSGNCVVIVFTAGYDKDKTVVPS